MFANLLLRESMSTDDDEDDENTKSLSIFNLKKEGWQ